MVPSTISKVSTTTVGYFGALSLQPIRLATYSSCFLRLVHVVTSIDLRFTARYVGLHFPVGTYTPDMLSTSWRTEIYPHYQRGSYRSTVLMTSSSWTGVSGNKRNKDRPSRSLALPTSFCREEPSSHKAFQRKTVLKLSHQWKRAFP